AGGERRAGGHAREEGPHLPPERPVEAEARPRLEEDALRLLSPQAAERLARGDGAELVSFHGEVSGERSHGALADPDPSERLAGETEDALGALLELPPLLRRSVGELGAHLVERLREESDRLRLAAGRERAERPVPV